MSAFDSFTHLAYLLAAACFVIGLHLMNSPLTARRGNLLSAAGMAFAVAVTAATLGHDGSITTTGIIVLAAGVLVGSSVGLWTARTVKMTAMPQLVSLFNAVGGGAAALVAVVDVSRYTDGLSLATLSGSRVSVSTALDVLIGAVTFTGSLVAAGKLQGLITGSPVVFRGARLLNAVLLLTAVGCGIAFMVASGVVLLAVIAAAALVLGVTFVLPIGGADMPVVISLLNAFTGTAVAMAGFVLDSTALITAGALVGASGGILTKLMADAMNRSLASIVLGGFGTGDTAAPITAASGGSVRQVAADDVAIQLAYAQKVIVVPGYGLAAAQAQHELVNLAELLHGHGVDVSYAIHPVAGRMPGHMNVLLAEANVPYERMKELEDVNPEFATADVALVVGANDVTNPAARRPGNAVSGMPILNVDHARNIVVIKRSMGTGYAGIDNELYTDPKTGMFFGDAKSALSDLAAAVKAFVH